MDLDPPWRTPQRIAYQYPDCTVALLHGKVLAGGALDQYGYAGFGRKTPPTILPLSAIFPLTVDEPR